MASLYTHVTFGFSAPKFERLFCGFADDCCCCRCRRLVNCYPVAASLVSSVSVAYSSFLISPTMSIPSQAAARCCRQLIRPSTSCLRLSTSTYLSQRTPSRRWQSTESEAAAAPANPKISQIVDQVSQLTLLETADLVSTLKVCYAMFYFLVEDFY